MNLNKLDSILKKNQEIKDFKVFDTDTEWNLFLEKVETPHSEINHQDTIKNKARFSILFIARAVAALVLLVLAFLVAIKEPEKTRASFTADTNQSNITLSDGSAITMTKGTKLDYPLKLSGQNERMILLDGTATFDVRNSILPFYVYSRELKVEVLGTKFIVSGTSDTSFIENLEGVVKVSEIKNPGNNVTLNKGDKFLYVSGTFKDLNYKEPIPDDKNNKILTTSQNDSQSKQNQETIQEPEKFVGSVYKLGSVLKDYLVKQNKKLIKIDKKFKYDSEQRVRVNLSGNYTEIINSLKSQGYIDTKPGDCPDCLIIIAPGSGK
jgi:hypothetical protein